MKLKRILLILIVVLLLSGCQKIEKNIEKEKEKPIKKEEPINEYIDKNNTPIGIYKLQGNKLVRLHDYKTKLAIEKDVDIFQLFPSNEEVIYLDESFGKSFYNEWIKYNNIKMGFNIKFSLINGENISYNIFGPNETFEKWEYLMNYLYDDYANLNKNFYSHLEQKDCNDETLYTSFKMQAAYKLNEFNSNIKLTVFTYDSEDDFLDSEYRGNSSYTLDIIIE